MARKSNNTAAPLAPPGKSSPAAKRLPVHQLLPLADILYVQGTAVELYKLNQIGSLLWFPEGISEEQKNAAIVAAIDLFDSLKPADGIETMLAGQMVGTHHAALECMRRAMVPGQTLQGRDANLNHAQRLMSLYMQQMTALNKQRGKGQQKITVERLQVAPGAQAVIGDVHAAQPQSDAAAIKAPIDGDVPAPSALAKAKVRR